MVDQEQICMRMALGNPDPKPGWEAVTLGEKGGFLHHSSAALSPIQRRWAWSGWTQEQVCHREDRDGSVLAGPGPPRVPSLLTSALPTSHLETGGRAVR